MRRCRRGPWDGGAGGVHKGHFHNLAGMVVRGRRRQSMCQPALHMSQRSIFSLSNDLCHTWHWVSSGDREAGEGGYGSGRGWGLVFEKAGLN